MRARILVGLAIAGAIVLAATWILDGTADRAVLTERLELAELHRDRLAAAVTRGRQRTGAAIARTDTTRSALRRRSDATDRQADTLRATALRLQATLAANGATLAGLEGDVRELVARALVVTDSLASERIARASADSALASERAAFLAERADSDALLKVEKELADLWRAEASCRLIDTRLVKVRCPTRKEATILGALGGLGLGWLVFK